MDGVRAMVLTAPLAPGLAMQVAEPLTRWTDQEVASVGATLALLSAIGVALAALVGWAVAGPGSRRSAGWPRRRGGDRDRRPGRRVEVERADELGRLAMSFNTMLARCSGRWPRSGSWSATPATSCAPR
jgi:HAMP domain-containing protein